MNIRTHITNKIENVITKIKRELNERSAFPSLFMGIFIYLFVSYLFAGSEFYRISHWTVGRSVALNAILTFKVQLVLSTFSSELFNSWFKQIVYQGIAGGITGSFVKEEVKSSIAICSSTLPFYAILVLLSNISHIGLIAVFFLAGFLIGVAGGIIGVLFYKEISEEDTLNKE